MNAMTVWKTTGATIDSAQRAFMAGVLLIAGVAAISLLRYQTSAASAAVVAYGLGLVFWWAFVVGRALLLQRDLRLLRTPDADRTVALNLALQFVALVLLPSAIISAFGGLRFAAVSGLLACFAIGGILWQVLPRWASIFLVFLPSMIQISALRGAVPGLSDPQFPQFAWAMGLVFAGVALWRWLALLKADADEFGPWGMPMVLQMRRQVGFGGGYRNFDLNALYAAAKKTGHDRQVQLQGAGADHPVKALRVWLGAAFTPLSLRARLSQSLYVLLPLLIGTVFMSFSLSGWKYAVNWGAMMLGMFVPAMCAGVVPARLSRLYRNAGGEIGLLATLPGLGGAASAKRSLLLASAGLMSQAILGFAVCTGVAMLLCGDSLATLSVVALPALGGIALNFAVALNLIGGRRIPHPATAALCIFGFIAVCSTPSLLALDSRAGAVIRHGFAVAIISDWLIVFALLAWLGVRGWRAYQHRPHPFLLAS